MNVILITIIVMLLGTSIFGGYKWYQFEKVKEYLVNSSDIFGGTYSFAIDKQNNKKFLVIPNEYELISTDRLIAEYSGLDQYPGKLTYLRLNKIGTTTTSLGSLIEVRKKTEII